MFMSLLKVTPLCTYLFPITSINRTALRASDIGLMIIKWMSITPRKTRNFC